jgi:hypothetical protein
MNQWDDEIDEGSSSGAVDEGHRAVAVDVVVGEEAPAGWPDGGGCGASRVFVAWVYEWGAEGMGGEPWLMDALVQNVG